MRKIRLTYIALIILILLTSIRVFSRELDYFDGYDGEKVQYEQNYNENTKLYTLKCLKYRTVEVVNANRFEALRELEDLYLELIIKPKVLAAGDFDKLDILNKDFGLTKEEEAAFNDELRKLKDFFLKYEWMILGFVFAFAFYDFVLIFIKAKAIADNPQIKRSFYGELLGIGSLMIFLGLYGTIKAYLAYLECEFLTAQNMSFDVGVNMILREINVIIVGMLGIGALTSILFFIIAFVKLGASASNPKMRADALKGIVINGVTTMFLSGAIFWFVFIINVFQ